MRQSHRGESAGFLRHRVSMIADAAILFPEKFSPPARIVAGRPQSPSATHECMRNEGDLDAELKSIGRRRLLQCMMWGSAGVVWTVNGGVPSPFRLDGTAAAAVPAAGELSFVQISDTHIGFKVAPNPDPGATLQRGAGARGFRHTPGLHDPHRRRDPSRQARTVRYRRGAHRGAPASRPGTCRASTT